MFAFPPPSSEKILLLTWLVEVALAAGPVPQGPIVAGSGVKYSGGNAVGPYRGGGGGGPRVAGVAGVAVAPVGGDVWARTCGGGPDFNPVLLQGVRGYPGIRARLNQRAFQYASGLIATLLNQEIRRARIPPIVQAPPGGGRIERNWFAEKRQTSTTPYPTVLALGNGTKGK
ncbi:hypothetical protein COOONC_23030 [Cooperia oncophora]